jgi:GxxExxY protein
MNENEISRIVVNSCFKIHKGIGPGLPESIYEDILEYGLRLHKLNVKREKAIPLKWDKLPFAYGFKADLIVENKVIIEVKSIEALAPVHHKQLLGYLKITGIKLGKLQYTTHKRWYSTNSKQPLKTSVEDTLNLTLRLPSFARFKICSLAFLLP